MIKLNIPKENKTAVINSLVEVLKDIHTNYTIERGFIKVSTEDLDESDIEILNGLAEQINITIKILKKSN